MTKKKQTKKKKAFLIAIVLISILLVSTFLAVFLFSALQKKIYPLEYEDIIDKACDEFNVSKPLICAVIKAESNFNKDAESKAGAKGLMQLMPDTYTWLAKKLGEGGEPEKITDPETNVRYGTYYISILINKYSDYQTALCAYNAGPGRVDGWLADTRYSSDGKKLDDMPYAETEKYIKRINEYMVKYEELYF